MRTGTRIRLALMLAASAAWASPDVLRAAELSRIAITVRVYQTAGLPSSLEQRALAEAAKVLRTALVDVRWQACNGQPPSPVCRVPLESSELVLRIVDDGASRPHRSLGIAVINDQSSGVLATVFADLVARVATTARTDVGQLLGRVAAHELAHLLMQTSGHGRAGLMRPNWTPDEVHRNLSDDWVITPDDMAAMRRTRSGY
jgi:hypothetical protein